MAEGNYSNGLPHPSRETRLRLALELLTLAVLTALFLLLAPPRLKNTGVYVGLALMAAGVIYARRRETEQRIWGPPESPEFDRIRRCFVGMSLLTIPPVVIFFAIGLAARMWFPEWFAFLSRITDHHSAGPCSMFSLHFVMALCCYIPWAMLQQFLFQFYLLGRLRALLPFASPLLLSTLNGIAYGLVHMPNIPLTLVTIIGGIFWSYSYYRDRYVLPLALSHALLGSTFYYWVYGRDIVGELFR